MHAVSAHVPFVLVFIQPSKQCLMTGRDKTVEKGSEILSYESMEAACRSVPIVFYAFHYNLTGFLFPSLCLF